MDLLKKHRISTLPLQCLRQVFSRSRENLTHTSLTLRRFYNVGGNACMSGPTCSHLHICRHFLKNTCKFNYRCKRSHNLLDQHKKQILENYGINTGQTPKDVLTDVQSMLQDDDEDMSSTASGYFQANSHGIATFRPNGNQAGFGQSPAHLFTRPSPLSGFSPLVQMHPPPKTNLVVMRTLSVMSVSSMAVADEETETCMFYLRGQCGFGNSCRMHHKDGPYQWQYLEEATGVWVDIADNETVEIKYCEVSCTECFIYASTKPGHKPIPCRLEFHDNNSMTLHPLGKKSPLKVRRLSTASSVQKPTSFIYDTKWIWYWLDENNKWKEYGAENCRRVKSNANVEDIENAFLASNGSISFDTTEGEKYDLDLARMVQRNVNYKTERKVRRRPEYIDWKDEAKLKRRTKGTGAYAKTVTSKTAGQSVSDKGTEKEQKSSSSQSLMSTSIPDHWDIYRAGDGSCAQTIELDEIDNRLEYKKIAAKFLASMPASEIRKIYRVQCLEVFDAYDRKKKWMTKQNKKAPKELELFHGTKKDNIQAICRQGFDCRISGSRTGTLYGKGTYFAVDAKEATGYADSKFVYLCKVLVGDSCQGMSHYVRPPPKDPKKPNENFYDSCVDKEADPKMYIVFKPEQAYPEYIIKYT